MTAPLAGALLGLLGGNAPASGAPAERCDAACGEGAVPCCTEVGLHGSGAPIAWLRRGAPIPITMAQGTGFSDADGTRPEAVVAELKRWLVGHSELAGLAPMADPSPLAGLIAWPRAPLRFGGIEVIRALQTYRGLPIWGAGETVSLTVSSPRLTVSSPRPTVSSLGGIVAIHGAIADARETYAGWEAPIGEAAALVRAQAYLAALADAGAPPRYTAASPQWVAIVEIRAMAYTLEVWDRGVTSPGEELAATQAGERSQENTPPRGPATTRQRTGRSPPGSAARAPATASGPSSPPGGSGSTAAPATRGLVPPRRPRVRGDALALPGDLRRRRGPGRRGL